MTADLHPPHTLPLSTLSPSSLWNRPPKTIPPKYKTTWDFLKFSSYMASIQWICGPVLSSSKSQLGPTFFSQPSTCGSVSISHASTFARWLGPLSPLSARSSESGHPAHLFHTFFFSPKRPAAPFYIASLRASSGSVFFHKLCSQLAFFWAFRQHRCLFLPTGPAPIRLLCLAFP